MKILKEVIVNAPAEKVWDIVGHNFAKIGNWDGSVSHSVVNNDIPKIKGAPYGGRVCKTSFGTISEKFYYRKSVIKVLDSHIGSKQVM